MKVESVTLSELIDTKGNIAIFGQCITQGGWGISEAPGGQHQPVDHIQHRQVIKGKTETHFAQPIV